MIAVMLHPLETLFVGSRSVHLTVGSVLFRRALPVSEMFFVTSGLIHLCRHTMHGSEMILQKAKRGMVVAEASAYSDIYHCDAISTQDCDVLVLPKPVFLSALASNPNLAVVWAATLARGVQAARLKIEIRSLPRVIDRLDAWLDEGNELPEKGQWQDVANELGISREALYRELARRRKKTAE